MIVLTDLRTGGKMGFPGSSVIRADEMVQESKIEGAPQRIVTYILVITPGAGPQGMSLVKHEVKETVTDIARLIANEAKELRR